MTKIETAENENYAATVVSVKAINPLENCDNVVGTPLFGFQAIVGKETQIGDLGIVLPAECQVSLDYAAANNLHRHSELNADPDKKGYLEDNRRVKAMKFRGHRSDCLFMPLESLSWTGANVSELSEGDTFDTLNGKEICRKYVVHRKSGPNRLEKNKVKKFERVDKRFLPEHFDTDNYWRNEYLIDDDREIVVTQKLHGTSIRIGNTFVARELKWKERLAKRLGIRVQESEHDYVYGSRKVIKDIHNPRQDHFYGQDIWTFYGAQLDGLLPEGFIVYGELIGWTQTGEPIQKDYTYRVPQGTAELYVYRIAQVNQQGRVTDLSWDQLKELCNDLGLKHVPEMWRGPKKDFDVDLFIDRRFVASGYTQCVQLDDKPDLVDEGVCVRVDGLSPFILKAKSPVFLQMESKLLDQEVEDIEAEQSVA
jgi:hypothetical protein